MPSLQGIFCSGFGCAYHVQLPSQPTLRLTCGCRNQSFFLGKQSLYLESLFLPTAPIMTPQNFAIFAAASSTRLSCLGLLMHSVCRVREWGGGRGGWGGIITSLHVYTCNVVRCLLPLPTALMLLCKMSLVGWGLCQ